MCPSKVSSSTQVPLCSLNAHILIKLSHPALANRLTAVVCDAGALGALGRGAEGVINDPGRTDGDQEMAFVPVAWAMKTEASQEPSSISGRQWILNHYARKADIGTFEGENGDFSVRRSASEDCSEIVGGPGDRVDWEKKLSERRR